MCGFRASPAYSCSLGSVALDAELGVSAVVLQRHGSLTDVALLLVPVGLI